MSNDTKQIISFLHNNPDLFANLTALKENGTHPIDGNTNEEHTHLMTVFMECLLGFVLLLLGIGIFGSCCEAVLAPNRVDGSAGVTSFTETGEELIDLEPGHKPSENEGSGSAENLGIEGWEWEGPETTETEKLMKEE
jgi:hypothetical protein